MSFDVKFYQQERSLDDYLGYNNRPLPQTTAQTTEADSIAQFFDVLAQNSGTDKSLDRLAELLTPKTTDAAPTTSNFSTPTVNTPPIIENYGGFTFKNDKEKAAVDQALSEMRNAQAANQGKAMDKTIKVGKYKFKIHLNEEGTVEIKRKKKKRGFFSKIGSALKGIGKMLKKALPIIATVAMFIPGLQPLALAARVATGVMGVVDGIKNGNIFGAVMGAVGAVSGIGGKIGSFASNLSSKATGLLGNVMKTGAGSWLQNTYNSVSNFIGKGSQMLNNFTGGIGTKVSNFLVSKGSNLLGNLTQNMTGKFGNWLAQNGSGLVRNFAESMGSRVTNWLNDKAYNTVNRLMNNPIGQRITNFLNSNVGQYLTNYLESRKA